VEDGGYVGDNMAIGTSHLRSGGHIYGTPHLAAKCNSGSDLMTFERLGHNDHPSRYRDNPHQNEKDKLNLTVKLMNC
jgi:hypothetical protein